MTRLFLTLTLATALTGVVGSFFNAASARPAGTAAIECVTDDGNGRYRPCSAGND